MIGDDWTTLLGPVQARATQRLKEMKAELRELVESLESLAAESPERVELVEAAADSYERYADEVGWTSAGGESIALAVDGDLDVVALEETRPRYMSLNIDVWPTVSILGGDSEQFWQLLVQLEKQLPSSE